MKDNLLCTLTVSELIDELTAAGLVIVSKPATPSPSHDTTPEVLDFSDSSRFGCGLRAIRERYNVSGLTAQRYKDTLLAPAIYQARRGGKFYVDFAKADEIMKTHKAKKEAPEKFRGSAARHEPGN